MPSAPTCRPTGLVIHLQENTSPLRSSIASFFFFFFFFGGGGDLHELTTLHPDCLFQGVCFDVDSLWQLYLLRIEISVNWTPSVPEHIMSCILKQWSENRERESVYRVSTRRCLCRWLLHTVMMNVSLCGRLYTGYTVVLWLCLIMGVFAQMPLVIHSVICNGISNRNSYLLILLTNLHHMTQYIWLKHTNTL